MFRLPYDTPIPDQPGKRRVAIALRVAAYVAFAAAVLIPVVQFTRGTARNVSKAAAYDRRQLAPALPTQPGATQPGATRPGPARPGRRPKAHKGAIGRWRAAVRPFWAGKNIYLRRGQPGGDSRVTMHPNMPLIVILITPLAYMSPAGAALVWSLAKVVALAAAVWMLAEVLAHGARKVKDWVLALGMLWVMLMITADIMHGNTNIFVLAAIVLHLWLFRRRRDYWSGASLALAICLKMTPAIFLLYWLQQRSWRVLVGALAGLIILAVIIPAVAVGPTHYVELTQTWLDNLVIPGLIKGAWYPVHINQSMSGVFSRYFLPRGEANSNIFWNPDDNPYDKQKQFGWITVVGLSPATVKWMFRLCQFAIVAAAGAAIGWRRLRRDDGRRALHYGLVIIAMLLLNQRTWGHHGAVLLIATAAIWQAIAFGRLGRGVRPIMLVLVVLAGGVYWATTADLVTAIGKALGDSRQEAKRLADVVKAYGPMFYQLVLLFVAGVLAAISLRSRQVPYAECRQKLTEHD